LGFRELQRKPIYYPTTVVLTLLLVLLLGSILLLVEASTLVVKALSLLLKKARYPFLDKNAKYEIRLNKLRKQMDTQWEIIPDEKNNL
jgi:hypothetical protein